MLTKMVLSLLKIIPGAEPLLFCITSGFEKEKVEQTVDLYFQELKTLVKDYMVTEVDDSMSLVVG